jgi:peroxiredoxin
MLWIRFDEEDRYSPAPDFCLETAGREQVCQSQFRGDCNLVVVFTHSLDCRACLDLLKGFVENQQSYQKEDARVLAVLPAALERLAEAVHAHPFLAEGPLTLLSDPEGSARKKYAALMVESLISEEDAALFILDSYGAPYAAAVGRRDLADAAIHTDALSWLSFIGMQCPE